MTGCRREEKSKASKYMQCYNCGADLTEKEFLHELRGRCFEI